MISFTRPTAQLGERGFVAVGNSIKKMASSVQKRILICRKNSVTWRLVVKKMG